MARREWRVNGVDDYSPLIRVVMTESVYTGWLLVYGEPPRCCVCGREIELGMAWRWYVPADLRPTDEPVVGCAEGHEGTVVEAGGYVWRIMPEGRRPQRLGRVGDVGRAAAV